MNPLHPNGRAHRARRPHAVLGLALPVAFLLLPGIAHARQDTTRGVPAIPGVQRTAGGVQIDFQDADIRMVIAALAEAGRLNVTYGELPPRRVTLRMRQPVPPEGILPLLRSLAQSNGLLVTEEAGMLRIAAAESVDPATGARRLGRAGAVDQVETRLYVYRLRHARAPKLAQTVQSLFTGVPGAGRGAVAPSPVGDPSTGTLSERLRNDRIQPGVPGDVAPRPAPPQAAVTGTIAGQVRGDIQIVPDEGTNSLLVRARPDDWEVVQQAIQALDLRPMQVLIEVLIAEVRRTSELDFGVSGVVRKEGTVPVTGTGGTPTAPPAAGTVGVFGSAGDLLLRITRGGNIDVDLAIAALAQRGNVRILSRPVILAQNNQQAKILVGSERPFVQVFRSLPTDNGVRDQIVQYRDVGTTLTITPTINPDGYVNLQVQQEVSTATDVQQFGAPVISTREASTYLFVRDGQTAVLGGLVDRQQDKSRGGIPLLSAIPGIGGLFGSTRNSTSVSELFLFLTPRLVRDDADVDQIREGVRSRSELLRDLPVNQTAIPPRPPPAP